MQLSEKNVPTEPTIDVYLRPVTPNQVADFGMAIKERVCCQIGVGQLPLLAIGSLWYKGQLREQRATQTSAEKTELRSLLINSTTVKLIEAGHRDNSDYYINKGCFDIGGIQNGLRAHCLSIEHEGDPYGIIVPAAEVIRFYYAASSDLSNIAFSGTYESDFNSIVGEFHHMHPKKDLFIVQLRKWLEDDDGWTIGRLLQEPLAEKGFIQIYNSLMRQSINVSMPEVGFPFSGQTDWTAHCIRFNSGGKSRILVLELLRCTAPFPFSDLEVIRDNDNRKANPETDLSDDEKLESWTNKEGRVKTQF